MPAILISPEQDASEILREQMATRLGQTAVWENPWLVYVDEAQFLEPRQVQQLAHTIVDSNVATIQAYGLLNDFRGELFPGSAELLRLADRKTQIPSSCERKGCGYIATTNARLVNGNIVTEGPPKSNRWH